MLRRTIPYWVGVGLGIACCSPIARAQELPQTREGFFIGFGLGWGSYGCSDCDAREGGLAAYLKLGGTLSQRILLGVESGGMTTTAGSARLTTSNVTGFAAYYPSAESGLFFKAGAGISFVEGSLSGVGRSTDTGLGVTLGLGYDTRLKENFSVTPFGNWLYGRVGGISTNVVQVGVGMTWH